MPVEYYIVLLKSAFPGEFPVLTGEHLQTLSKQRLRTILKKLQRASGKHYYIDDRPVECRVGFDRDISMTLRAYEKALRSLIAEEDKETIKERKPLGERPVTHKGILRTNKRRAK